MAVVKVQFANSDLEVISLKDDSGELWMLANPFARILEYSNANKAVRVHVLDKNQCCLEAIHAAQLGPITSSIHPQSKFINRAGLFELIQASRMPKAQEFRDWINSDLLPKLCDEGKYDMAVDAPIEIAHGMNAVHVATNDGAEAPWLRDLSELKQVIVKKDELIAIKDEENKKLTVALQDANQSLAVANNALITLSQNMSQALVMVNEARIDSENARKETAQLANRMADIAQDVIAKPSDPELLHSLAVCALGGDQYAFVRPQKRSLKRTLNRLSVDDSDIVFKRDYVPNSMNVLNKVKENLPKDKYKARHNKITLLEDLTKEDLVEAINASLTQRQVAIIANKAQKL
ncbi:bro [Trichoplusia ni granulovirus LBIV-12]|uniref:Bro n=1 Tax=Trichoplusia ni granulovirus LBIV-12 TaxID=1916701 RepID=A0A1D8QLF9_GVTN|nr:bro [Trichoplusia ni granulovirus LBIV-12]AOW41493.1 bro [Trichoplusia ni granulovirus LBIV-12]